MAEGEAAGRNLLIGFVGLGQMGRPMALNLLKGGHALRVFDPSADATALVAAAEMVAFAPTAVLPSA